MSRALAAYGVFLLELSTVAAFTTGSSGAAFARGIRELQDHMIQRAEAADPSAKWTIDEHSRGRACIIEEGELWEKGCISVTLIEDGALTATARFRGSNARQDGRIFMLIVFEPPWRSARRRSPPGRAAVRLQRARATRRARSPSCCTRARRWCRRCAATCASSPLATRSGLLTSFEPTLPPLEFCGFAPLTQVRRRSRPHAFVC